MIPEESKEFFEKESQAITQLNYSEKDYIDGLGSWTTRLTSKTVADIKRLLQNYMRRQSDSSNIEYAERRFRSLTHGFNNSDRPYKDMVFSNE